MITYNKKDIPEHLQKYFEPAEIGLEQTPDAYVAKMVDVFREVRRVLRDDGTCWINLGDSYAGGGRGCDTVKQKSNRGTVGMPKSLVPQGLKVKDLVGIPWRVAFALQQPYYTGKIKKEQDRIWLAAIIDGEGCFFIHKRKAGSCSGAKFKRASGEEVSYSRVADTYSVGLEICNTNLAIIERIQAVAGRGSIQTQTPEQNSRRKQTIYRWRCSPSEAREIAQEVYPHLVGKQHQARLVYGAPTTGDKATQAHQALMNLHNGVVTTIDLPDPPTMFEPGWYLRQDVIWAKPNPMPESVTDRCTKAHEYIFLLTKSERYWYDAEAIREDTERIGGSPRQFGATKQEGTLRQDVGNVFVDNGTRNRRSVWTVATKPYKGAHFATFPPKLIEPCILAGCPRGGVVLDPFAGSGTTLAVALQHGRQAIGIELNAEYIKLIEQRIERIQVELI